LGGLSPGTYTFTLTVSDGPCSDSDQVTVTILDLPIADAGPDHVIFLSETAQLGGSPTGPAGSAFNWEPDSLLNDGSIADPIADPQETTWFTVLVTAPNGCVALDSVLVTVVPEVVITNGFTPNGDGWNDAWVIDYIDLFPECEVEIYNRWGDLLFRSVGYKTPWDGRYNGGFVPVGTYYYVIKLNDARFPEPYTGPLTVIR
jgi:gliding motility-associated-like protein